RPHDAHLRSAAPQRGRQGRPPGLRRETSAAMARALAWCQSASLPMGQCSIMPHRSLCIAARVLLPSLFIGPYGHRHCPGWYERQPWRHTVERSPTPYVEQPSWRSTQSSARRWPCCSNAAESPIAPSSASVPWTTRFLAYLRSPSSALREVRIEFIPLKSSGTKGSGAPGNCAGRNRVQSPDHGPLASTDE